MITDKASAQEKKVSCYLEDQNNYFQYYDFSYRYALDVHKLIYNI